MFRSLISVLALGALPAPTMGEEFSRLLECRTPYAEARATADAFPITRHSDRSTADYQEHNYYLDPIDIVALGMPVRSAAISWFESPKQFEYTIVARVEGRFADWRNRLLTRYGRADCDAWEGPEGNPVCLLHLGTDPGGEAYDVDVQVALSGERVQVECLYGDVVH